MPNLRMLVVAATTCCLATLTAATRAHATAGDLDPSFGGTGLVTYSSPPTAYGSPDEGHAVAIQSDGKIVLAGSYTNSYVGSIVLVRVEADGTLDGSFGSGVISRPLAMNSLTMVSRERVLVIAPILYRSAPGRFGNAASRYRYTSPSRSSATETCG